MRRAPSSELSSKLPVRRYHRADITNFTNRSPYPMLHLLREASVDRAVAAYPDAAEISDRSIETLRRLGHAGWRRLWVGEQSKE